MMLLHFRHLFAAGTLAFSISTASLAQDAKTNAQKSADLTLLAGDAVKIKNNQQAEKLYLQAVELDSKNGPAWRGLAKVASDKGNQDKAISFLKEGWSCGDAASLKDLGALFIEERKYKDFEEFIPGLMKLKDTDVEARALLVYFKLKGGNLDQAAFEKVMAGLDPATLASKNDDTLLLFIKAYGMLGDTADADNLRAMLGKRGPASAAKADNIP